jgi:hypothetical protein
MQREAGVYDGRQREVRTEPVAGRGWKGLRLKGWVGDFAVSVGAWMQVRLHLGTSRGDAGVGIQV